jgi:signal peptidase I
MTEEQNILKIDREEEQSNAGTAPAPTSGRRPAKAKPSVLKDLMALLLKIFVIAGIAVLIFTFIYGLHRTEDPAMSPAIKGSDLVVFYRFDKDYKAEDVLLLTFQGKRQVRRVVAIEGDTVDITEDGLVINGALQQEPNVYEKTERYEEGVDFPLVLGNGQVFVLGDARDGATDSRIYGAVDAEDTSGTVIAVIRRKNI